MVDRVYPGSTADIELKVRDNSNNLTDLDGTPTITIVDPDGAEVVTDDSMTKESTGTYVYFYTTNESGPFGLYEAIVSGDADTSGGTRTEKRAIRFKVTKDV